MSDSGKDTRTDWAEDRTVLANERTFASWIGTGLGAVGIAIALRAVFGAMEPTWVAKAVASLFLIVAILIYWMACRKACRTVSRLSNNDAEALTGRGYVWLASGMTIATAATGAVLWSL